jgi:hypothetical protein
MPQLIIKIVDRGTNHTNQKTGETKPSLTGHMWFELVDDNGNISSHGFAPADGYEGRPFAPVAAIWGQTPIFPKLLLKS